MVIPFYLNYKIRLLSQSPRRYALLKDAGFEVEKCPMHVDETVDDTLPYKEQVEALALRKLQAYTLPLEYDMVCLAADTMVFLDGCSLGKPNNPQEAMDFLVRLSDNKHEVITGVAMKFGEDIRSIVSETSIYFDPISREEIAYYLGTSEVLDKAGGYGIQDWIGLTKIRQIEGDYYSVMGLPVQKIIRVFSTWLPHTTSSERKA